MRRNGMVIVVLCIALVLSSISVILAEEYPNKPITLIVGFSAGGTTDLSARKLAELANKYLNNQPILIETKAGGAGTVGLTAFINAKPDGYTLVAFTFSPTVLIPHMRKISYDVKKDFEPIMQYAEYPTVFVVRHDNPANTWKDWIEWAKKNVEKATYSTAGPGSGAHIFMQEVFLIEKINPTHIPFGGGSEATVALLGGNVNAILGSETARHIKSGQLKPLATENPDGLSYLPNVPSFKQLRYDIRTPLWCGIAAPAKTPAPILKKLEDAFIRAAKEPIFQEMMKTIEMAIVLRDSASFKKMVEEDYDYYGPVIKRLGLSYR